MHRSTRLLSGLLLAMLTTMADAATLFVTNNGTDSAACGASAATACRSIGRAIDNAAVGDKISVGPGLYGDLDDDGAFTSPGDEGADAGTCDCVLLVDKQVTVFSRDGARATQIRVRPGNLDRVVLITAGAVFGKKNQGFSITGDLPNGLNPNTVSAVEATGGSSATIAGNIVGGYARGISASANGTLITDNESSGNILGMLVTGDAVRVERNAIRGNRNSGIRVAGLPNLVRIKDNVIVGNATEGIAASGTGLTIQHNTLIGNGEVGVLLALANVVGDTSAEITGNSMFGNSSNFVANPSTFNCGIATVSAGAVTAPGNFWGAASGPGADPADAVCDLGVGTTDVPSIATKEIKVLVKPQR